MDKNDLHRLLGKQFLITAYIEPKIQIVNFIKNGYDDNKPVLMNNRFLHFTAHIFYRSIVIDLAGLFSDGKRTHKNNFNQIISNENYSSLLTPESIKEITLWLIENISDIEMIKTLRDKEIAHYDFDEKEAISLNFNNIGLINSLFSLSKAIIEKAGGSFLNNNHSVNYHFDSESHYIRSLKRLINES